jgi:hypothetical protein
LGRIPQTGESGFAAGVDKHVRKLDILKNLPAGQACAPRSASWYHGFEVLGSCFIFFSPKQKGRAPVPGL